MHILCSDILPVQWRDRINLLLKTFDHYLSIVCLPVLCGFNRAKPFHSDCSSIISYFRMNCTYSTALYHKTGKIRCPTNRNIVIAYVWIC